MVDPINPEYPSKRRRTTEANDLAARYVDAHELISMRGRDVPLGPFKSLILTPEIWLYVIAG